jgi:hypothetical protein
VKNRIFKLSYGRLSEIRAKRAIIGRELNTAMASAISAPSPINTCQKKHATQGMAARQRGKQEENYYRGKLIGNLIGGSTKVGRGGVGCGTTAPGKGIAGLTPGGKVPV